MDTIPFDEMKSYIGRKVRVLTIREVMERRPDNSSTAIAYHDILGHSGVIVESARLPWVDKEKHPYNIVTIKFSHEERLSHCGVEMLELIDEDNATMQIADDTPDGTPIAQGRIEIPEKEYTIPLMLTVKAVDYQDACKIADTISESVGNEGENIYVAYDYETDNVGQRVYYLPAIDNPIIGFVAAGVPVRQSDLATSDEAQCKNCGHENSPNDSSDCDECGENLSREHEQFGGRPIGEAFNDPRVPCCGRDIADCDCEAANFKEY